MQAFKSDDLAINLDVEAMDNEALMMCGGSSLAVLLASCGTTQNTKPLCKVPPAELRAEGLQGLESLKSALRQWMEQVEPLEQALRAEAEASSDAGSPEGRS